MTRNIMTDEGRRIPVESVTEFEVSGIKLFTYFNINLGEWRVTELTSGFAFRGPNDTELEAIESVKAKISKIGPEKIMEGICEAIKRCGVANEEAKK